MKAKKEHSRTDLQQWEGEIWRSAMKLMGISTDLDDYFTFSARVS
jgi:hypothetical protein